MSGWRRRVGWACLALAQGGDSRSNPKQRRGSRPSRKIRKEDRKAYCNSLGNLLLLSSAVNSSLQNDAFAEKKEPKHSRDGTTKLRNGYADGSHSEIDVSRNDDWGPAEIRDRGMRMIRFMEKRWNISFGDDQTREKLLFIGSIDGDD